MDIKRVYLIGIGGIGMAALARYYLANNIPVAGYDHNRTHLTDTLTGLGAHITYTDDTATIPAPYLDPDGTLIIYTPAIPPTNNILQHYSRPPYTPHKRAQVLGLITRHSKGICFAGTHGKTTTSSMAAHLLHNTPAGCNAFLGGILRNYDSNLLLSPRSPYTVIEADEYDRSFHHLRPHIAVITSVDPDHLDIYHTPDAYRQSFEHFTGLIQPGGALIMHTGLPITPRLQPGVRLYTYSRTHGDYHADNIRHHDGRLTFDLVHPGGTITGITLGVPVDINIDNAIAALAATHLTGLLTPDVARHAMSTFLGPERRFQKHLDQPGPHGHIIIDDYAHHPDELRASILSLRALYPHRHLTVAFQPHLYSRTRDFAPQFADALSLADRVILLPIYPAREQPIPGITSHTIYDLIKNPDKHIISKENFVETTKNLKFEVLLTAGAGDINLQLPALIDTLQTQQ